VYRLLCIESLYSLLAFEIVYIVKYYRLHTQNAMFRLLAFENVYIVSLKRMYTCIVSFDCNLQRLSARLV